TNTTYTVGGGVGFNASFSVSALTDSRTYQFWCSAQNITGGFTAPAQENSTVNISITIDDTAPVISIPLYTNATAMNTNTSLLTLNISVTDATVGLNGSVCKVNINGSNQSFAVSGGWCNFTTGNLTGLADGINKIRVYVNDTVNNLGLNNSFYVTTDTVNPLAVPSCSPSTVGIGDSFPCTCGGTDATAGINNSRTTSSTNSPDGTGTIASTGTYTFTCNVYDYAGNSNSGTFTYYVNPALGPLGSNSGSTSSPAVTSQPKIAIFSQIVPGTPAIISNFDSATALNEIDINVNNPATNVEVTVTRYNSKPDAISAAKTGDVFQYLQIKVDNVEGKLNNATIISKVNKSWVSGNGLDKNNIAVFKFDNSTGQWNELQTNYSSEDNNYYYYTSQVNSFSYFAISEKSLVAGQTTGAQGTNNANGTSMTFSNIFSNYWTWIVAGIIAIVIAFFMRRKKK
ncbi:MAG TPA: PGF-pre-PGF domain-containing protein, partial [Candidatus Omnitrophota bacterium]|nr:PGF-pre-PGF domain-containing protein [Candidatus Omnitrophota bacterium]